MSCWFLPRFVYADSFVGDDWLLDMDGTLHINVGSILPHSDEPIDLVNGPITVTQSSTTDITLPLYIPDPVNDTFELPGTVCGTNVTAFSHLDQVRAGHLQLSMELMYTFLLRNIDAQARRKHDGD